MTDASDFISYAVRSEQAGLRADAFLALRAPFLSRTCIKRLIMTGEVLLNGNRLSTSTRLREGDRLLLRRPRSDETAPFRELEVLYEDDRLLAVAKPAGVPIHPVGRKLTGTLIQSVREMFRGEIEKHLALGDPGFYPSLVNRLDLFSSGVVLIAKDKDTLAAMHRLIAQGAVQKRYLVLVRGSIEPASGTIEEPIGPDPAGRIRIKRAVRPDGLRAATRYEVLERLPGYSLAAAYPLTGRQHQVRVHFASLGHPVWGDLIYEDEALFLQYFENGCRLDPSLPPRQGLHAERMSFHHPASGRELEIVSPLPEDFQDILRHLRRR